MKDPTEPPPSGPRCLPLYGGTDAGPRPGTREAVFGALGNGWSPARVADVVGLGIDETVGTIAKHGYPGGTPACARGCSHCCHQRVEVTAPEALAIAKHLRETWDDDARAVLATRLDETATRMRERASHRDPVACAFLAHDGTCLIYTARPHACRRGHSLDAEVCRVAKEDPTSQVLIPDNTTLSWNTAAVILGYREGFARAQRPLGALEMNAAVAIASGESDAEERWMRGEDVFAPARTKTEEEVVAVLGKA